MPVCHKKNDIRYIFKNYVATYHTYIYIYVPALFSLVEEKKRAVQNVPLTCNVLPRPMQCARMHPFPLAPSPPSLSCSVLTTRLSYINCTPSTCTRQFYTRSFLKFPSPCNCAFKKYATPCIPKRRLSRCYRRACFQCITRITLPLLC